MNISYIPPDIRAYLIAQALKFVLAASKLPGVTRIALFGSLVTDKKEPKDADLLVTVMDDIDLEPLNTLTYSRQRTYAIFITLHKMKLLGEQPKDPIRRKPVP